MCGPLCVWEWVYSVVSRAMGLGSVAVVDAEAGAQRWWHLGFVSDLRSKSWERRWRRREEGEENLHTARNESHSVTGSSYTHVNQYKQWNIFYVLIIANSPYTYILPVCIFLYHLTSNEKKKKTWNMQRFICVIRCTWGGSSWWGGLTGGISNRFAESRGTQRTPGQVRNDREKTYNIHMCTDRNNKQAQETIKHQLTYLMEHRWLWDSKKFDLMGQKHMTQYWHFISQTQMNTIMM